MQRSCHDVTGGHVTVHGVGPVRSEPRRSVFRDPVTRRRRALQPPCTARVAQDPESHQQAARIFIALPVHPRHHDPGFQPYPVRHVTVQA